MKDKIIFKTHHKVYIRLYLWSKMNLEMLSSMKFYDGLGD